MKHKNLIIDKPVLIVVAHPEDELLFAGGLLAQGRTSEWHILSLTGGNVGDPRSDEFSNVCNILGVQHSFGHQKDVWFKALSRSECHQHITSIISRFPIIVTHNPSGEYGHKHHIQTSYYVTEIVNKINTLYRATDGARELHRLLYFGDHVETNRMLKLEEFDKAAIKNLRKHYRKSNPSLKKTFGDVTSRERYLEVEDWV